MLMEKRPYQQRILTRTREAWERGSKSVLIVSPPGSGKTVMGFSIGQDIYHSAERLLGVSPKDVGFGWVAMRRNLLVQAEEENKRLVGCPNVHFISMFEKKPMEVMRHYKKHVLFLDEAHHEATDSAHTVVNEIDPAFLIGLSATPQRTDRMKLCFQTVVKDAGFHSLIEQGYLSQFDHWMLEDWQPSTIANEYISNPDRWGQSVMFFLTFAECEECLAILHAGGVKAEIVTAETDRFDQIDRFEDGKLDVLVNMFILTEGFNHPRLKTVWVRDSSHGGPTTQMAGRVLRKHPDFPIKQIVQSVGTKFPFTRVAKARQSWVRTEKIWRSVGATEMVKTMEKKMLERIMANQVSLPTFILKHRTKKRAGTGEPQDTI